MANLEPPQRSLLLNAFVVLLLSCIPICTNSLKVVHPFALRRQFHTGLALFGAPPLTTRDTTADLIVAMPLFLCSPPENKQRMKGQIVLTQRGGGCSFSHKALVAQRAGAIGVVIGNTEQEVFTMADDGAGHMVGIHVEMVSSDDFTLLYQAAISPAEDEVVEVTVGRQVYIGPYLV